MLIRKQWLSISWALFILILTGIPGNQIPRIPDFLEWLSPDKVVHLIMFGLLSYFILYGNRRQYFKSKKRSFYIINAILISAAYGVVTEILQVYVFSGRSGNIFDASADLLGALIGGVAYYLRHIKNNDETKSI
jgi:VanZ family protein